jgi:hypothetical protein
MGSISRRLLNWALYDIDQPQVASADIVIHPDTTGISLISTTNKDIKKHGIAEGEKNRQGTATRDTGKTKRAWCDSVRIKQVEPGEQEARPAQLKRLPKTVENMSDSVRDQDQTDQGTKN